MADYTYATPSGKTYDEFTKEAQERARKNASAYTEKANAANETYKTATNAIYDNAIRAQEEAAAVDTKKAHASYNEQFDANAASQLARERHLKEQMANLGLSESGYNATNQTAIAVSRSNADAKTRTARQQAVDTIAEELRKYRADMEAQRATTLADSDRDTANRIMDTEQAMLQNAHGEAMDMINRDDALAEFDWSRKQDTVANDQWQKTHDLSARELKEKTEQSNREYVDSHNRDIYNLMLDAFNSGNSALANEYAKNLWQIDEGGAIVPMAFDTAAASQYVNEQVELDRQAAASTATTSTPDKDDLTGYNALGFPKAYESSIDSAKKMMDDLIMLAAKDEVSPENLKTSKNQVMHLLYSIVSADDNGAQMLNDEDVVRMLNYVGLSKAEFKQYIALHQLDPTFENRTQSTE